MVFQVLGNRHLVAKRNLIDTRISVQLVHLDFTGAARVGNLGAGFALVVADKFRRLAVSEVDLKSDHESRESVGNCCHEVLPQ